MFAAVILTAFVTALLVFLVATDQRAIRAGARAVSHPDSEREALRVHPGTLRSAT